MIEYIEGDIFNSPAQVIVNTVNTVGVMGKGIALSYKNRYPDMFELYRIACEKKQLKIGKLMIYYAPDHWILLFPTKENWRKPSRLEYIEAGLIKFVETYAEKNITSIAFPRLGCGNGELNWEEVKELMEKYLKHLPIDIYIYLGAGNSFIPEHKDQKKTMEWLRKNAKDMSFNGIRDDIINNSSLLALPLNVDNIEWTIRWDKGLIFDDVRGNKTFFLCEDNFFELWDYVREKSIFAKHDKSKEEILSYALLEKLGYLSPIQIKDSKSHNMMEGYQLNEGYGRLFGLRGN